MMMFRCSCCGETKTEDEFHRNKSRKTGYNPYCKACSLKKRAAYVAANRDALNERQRSYYASHQNERRQYYQKNRSTILEKCREYRRKNMSAIMEKWRVYAEENPEKIAAQKAVREAIKLKQIVPARKCKCADCGKKAAHLHHESYAPENWLVVVPLCRSCHKLRHTRGEKL